ncbi:hypothetical protein GKQ77_22525 [Streptomyces sp. BG9H]|uniref:Uncharacterized protein n=1 Tax=Streptomyces anatolicus TaxID=2675858 RepID=A0ABS6YS94_9ACTN|nr:hypothetical protein [Streptomyces anatolicus]MBW5424309.1 hypothetical protein [Streptomyces anatolicus]
MARALRAWLASVGLFALVAFLPGLVEGEGPSRAVVVAAAVSCGVLPLCRRSPLAAFAVERLLTVWRAGRRAPLLVLPLLPELLYDAFIQAVFVRSVLDVLRRRTAQWHHVGQRTAT